MNAAKAAPLTEVAVIGAGDRGQRFAKRCVRAGFTVVLEDVLTSRLRRAEQWIAAEPPAVQRRLRLADTVEQAVRTADIAIDFVPDELESKLEILCMMDRMAPPRTIFCTPTHLSLTDLASCTYRARQCVALDPSYDETGAEIELVRGAQTATGVAEQVQTWLEALGFRVQTRTEELAARLSG